MYIVNICIKRKDKRKWTNLEQTEEKLNLNGIGEYYLRTSTVNNLYFMLKLTISFILRLFSFSFDVLTPDNEQQQSEELRRHFMWNHSGLVVKSTTSCFRKL